MYADLFSHRSVYLLRLCKKWNTAHTDFPFTPLANSTALLPVNDPKELSGPFELPPGFSQELITNKLDRNVTNPGGNWDMITLERINRIKIPRGIPRGMILYDQQ